jgi:hypothetical protein
MDGGQKDEQNITREIEERQAAVAFLPGVLSADEMKMSA